MAIVAVCRLAILKRMPAPPLTLMMVHRLYNSSLQCRRILGARVHIFLLGFHLRFGNCGGLGRGNICRGSRC